MEYLRDIDRLRHSCSHVMAQAVQELWSDTKVTIGPAIENGFYYDFYKEAAFSDIDLRKIEKRMQRIIQRKAVFKQTFMSKEEAICFFKSKNESFKVEIIENLEDEEVSIYHTGDEWLDLCKGPHIEKVEEIKAFKLLSVAGSYWRGDKDKERLQRIYGTAFFTQEELDEHLQIIEEAKKRDHRVLGPQLGLFDFHHNDAGAGLVFYNPPGAMLRKLIEDYIQDQNLKRGYDLVITPHILKGKLWETSGHADNYRENMYWLDVDGEEYAVKPMNCPGHILIYKGKVRSYRDLPVRYAEMGTVYRQEKAGVLHGLLRVRGFTQDDGHVFCREDQIKEEVLSIIDYVFDVMNDFGFKDITVELSTKPEKHIGSDRDWQMATDSLEEALKEKNLFYEVNEGEGAFYGPKIDIKLRDALKREWQCATIQCDFSLPQRFGISYITQDGKKKQPIMLHRAILGSIERFFGTLIEHYAGVFPVWLAPVQVLIIPISDRHNVYAIKVKEELHNHGLRCIIDCKSETLGKRIRTATVKKTPYVFILGDEELKEKKVTVRKYVEGDIGSMELGVFVDRIKKEIDNKS